LWRIRSCPKLNDEELWSCNTVCWKVVFISCACSSNYPKLQGNITMEVPRKHLVSPSKAWDWDTTSHLVPLSIYLMLLQVNCFQPRMTTIHLFPSKYIRMFCKHVIYYCHQTISGYYSNEKSSVNMLRECNLRSKSWINMRSFVAICCV
jgi:hypothetical protein